MAGELIINRKIKEMNQKVNNIMLLNFIYEKRFGRKFQNFVL